MCQVWACLYGTLHYVREDLCLWPWHQDAGAHTQQVAPPVGGGGQVLERDPLLRGGPEGGDMGREGITMGPSVF